jgi:hypothetical protein
MKMRNGERLIYFLKTKPLEEYIDPKKISQKSNAEYRKKKSIIL